MGARWQLTGRDAELAAGVAALRAGHGVLVAGGRGTGRTRLAIELAEGVGAAVVRLTATAAARGTPLGAFAAVVADGPTDLARVQAGLLPATGAARPVLLVDDAHLLDDASAAVVLQLAVTGGALVVATTATGVAAPDAVTALWKDRHVTRVDIAPLRADAIANLVEAELQPAVEGTTRHALVVAAAGSPQALEQLIDEALAAGTLHLDAGLWRLRGPLGWGGRSADLVADRVAELSDDEREALELLAIAGQHGVSMFEGIVGAAVLERLDRLGHLVTDVDGARVEIRLDPALHGALRAQLSPLRVRWLSRRLADALAATPRRRSGDRVTLVGWQLDAGVAIDGDELLTAALDASRSLDDDTALRLAREAWTSTNRVDAGHVLGRLLWIAGKHAAAETVLADAMDRADDDPAIVHVSNTRATNLLRGLHDASAADAVFGAARRRVTDAECRDALDAHHAAVDFLRGDVAGATGRAELLLDERRPWPYVEAATAAVPAFALGGRTEEAVTLAERAYAVYSGLPPRPYAQDNAGIHLMTLATALVYAGRLDDAERLASACYDVALAQGSTAGVAWFALLRGNVAEQRGAMEQARPWLMEAADAFDRAGEVGMRRVSVAHVALVAAVAGDGAGARDALITVAELEHTAVRVYDSIAVRAQAWLDALDGDLRRAHDRIEGALLDDAGAGRVSLAIAAAHDLARLGGADRAHALLAHVRVGDGRLLPARRAHVAALVADDATALEAVADDFEAAGALLVAAEALAGAARRRSQAGEGRRAVALSRRATALAERCPGAATPALAALATVGARLTPRESELVALAAKAMNNAEIASRLGLSVRTVENHLGRAYAKLGVRGRDELTPP